MGSSKCNFTLFCCHPEILLVAMLHTGGSSVLLLLFPSLVKRLERKKKEIGSHVMRIDGGMDVNRSEARGRDAAQVAGTAGAAGPHATVSQELRVRPPLQSLVLSIRQRTDRWDRSGLDPRGSEGDGSGRRCWTGGAGRQVEATVVWTGRWGARAREVGEGETADHVALLAPPAWRAAAVFPPAPLRFQKPSSAQTVQLFTCSLIDLNYRHVTTISALLAIS